MSTAVPVRPASTVVLLRDIDHDGEAELLLVRRNRALAFAGGFWVFPGGAVDAADRERAGDEDEERAARFAAAREAEEEAGVRPDPEQMALVSHWTTPEQERKRFSTWIFAATVPAEAEVVIDNSEIHDFQWLSAREALAAHRAGELALMPPTYITLCALARYHTAIDAVVGERTTPVPRVLPTLIPCESEGFVTVYEGDVAFGGGDPEAPGPRHRCELRDGSWHYQISDDAGVPPLYPLEDPA
jgi:8-oxo-dGTP pyrophosphatase MutT (NUDIX family)